MFMVVEGPGDGAVAATQVLGGVAAIKQYLLSATTGVQQQQQ